MPTGKPAFDAVKIFRESALSLMAHTIRGTVNLFRKHGVDLDILVLPDSYGQIPLSERNASVLMRRVVGGKIRLRIEATIFIHKHATKHLARICIAHEVFHLILELHHWIEDGRKQWSRVPTTKELEDQCNLFARDLCFRHEKFNRDEKWRSSQIYFPEGLFDSTVSTDTSLSENWLNGIGLDENHPFYLLPNDFHEEFEK